MWLEPLGVSKSPSQQLRQVFARNVRLARNAAGVSQEELASQAAISQTYLSQVESATRAVSIDVIERLASALKISVSELMTEHL